MDFQKEEKIEMPIADGLLGAYFGMFRDKYGIQWMVNFA
jgi:PhnB protein